MFGDDTLLEKGSWRMFGSNMAINNIFHFSLSSIGIFYQTEQVQHKNFTCNIFACFKTFFVFVFVFFQNECHFRMSFYLAKNTFHSFFLNDFQTKKIRFEDIVILITLCYVSKTLL